MAATSYPNTVENFTHEKVFCGRCIHRKRIGCTGEHCKSNPTPRFNAIHSWMQPADCEVKNKNNDCEEFEPKRSWWLR